MTDPTPAEERETLLPRAARHQRELAAAVDDLQLASRDLGRRAVLWAALVLGSIVIVRVVRGWRRAREPYPPVLRP